MKVTWKNAWAVLVLRAIDIFWATLIWRDYGVTISSWTGLALRKPSPPRWAQMLGWVLDHVQASHCELAIAADIQRARDTLTILGVPNGT